jgi:hypothetical protein
MIPKTAVAAALALLAGTAAGLAGSRFLPRNEAGARPDPDTRQVAALSAEEASVMRSQMRDNLTAIQEILTAAYREDMPKVVLVARRSAMNRPHDALPSLETSLPPEFRMLGRQVHSDFEALARDAETGLAPGLVPGRVALLIARCQVCHEQWRFGVE